MDYLDYKSFWNERAASPAGAIAAVDGSQNETTLQLTGAYSARQVAAALALRAGDRVFELGCGVGRIGRELAGHFSHWHGLDIAENMLAVARDRLAGIDGVQLDVLTESRLTPLADASVDKGYCVAVFIHMDKEDFLLYLRDVARVLVPGGLFYFDHWNFAHPVGWRRFDLEVAQAAITPANTRKNVARNQFCIPEEVATYVRHAGLEIVHAQADSPWVQMVVRKPDGDAAAAERESARCRAQAATIAYEPKWTEYFDGLLDAEIDRQPPHALQAKLAAAAQTELVTRMYRAYLRGLWALRTEQWGPVPAELDLEITA
ncbi:MAG TPA: class I SAM-dependent methyltransferase [Arenimonas sp.]|uniref:class I SAM-dependent methyltransferase n=1 Tax=Arenimonas sp. TaxID=1872635 RepID=UPI002B6B48C8|nr:class I SAM-dependent methyltransferase [Arenimonas sp.]HMB57142.1 class I SAM-dependent methyltransferase [Arenimonas sp.]